MGRQEEPKMQSEKFKAMAKELEADGDEKTFDEKLKALSQRVKKPAND
jgi:hypothetical protein